MRSSFKQLQYSMAATSKRRRFLVFMIICCLIYFLFSWYIKADDTRNSTINFITDINEEPNALEDDGVESTLHNLVEIEAVPEVNVNPEGIRSGDIDTNTPLHNEQVEPIDSSEDIKRLLRFKQSKQQPSNIISSETLVTYDPEFEFSGPTDDDALDFSVTKSPMNKLHTELDESSGPTDGLNPYHTNAYRHSDMDLEFSGPTESMSILITEAPIYESKESPASGSANLLQTESTTISNNGTGIPGNKKNPALIIDTPGCKIPKMDPFDPTVRDLIEIKDGYKCPGNPLFMTGQPHGIIHLNESVLKEYYNTTPDAIECWYQAIHRKREEPGNVRENDYRIGSITPLKFDVPMEDEYIAAKCYFSNNETMEQYFPLVKLKKEIEEERTKIKSPSPLNVILLGIDSVSKLNFMRHFRKTKAFLKDKLSEGLFDMKGYTKVGDNTFPNLVPLLSGHFVEYYWNESVRDTFVFDNVDLIWKDYAKKGFRTFYAEDSPYTGTFNYIKRGFLDPPTDYYYRPMALAIEQSNHPTLRESQFHPYCLNSELETDAIYDYLQNFVNTMDDKPYIAFAMVSIMTHDYLNSASYADPPAARILGDLLESDAFNKSLVVLFSDHGLRFGDIRHTYIGKFEERMPFMYLHLPKWFLDQYPEFAKNLKSNQDRLMTLFDVHATMKHLLYLNGDPMPDTDEIGISLFNEIPDNRTCEDASILQHWCPCNNFETVAVTDPKVVNASQAIINHINDILINHQNVCAHLEVAEVTDSRLGMPNGDVLRFYKHENVVENRAVVFGEEPKKLGDYLITLTAKPGGAIFEGTVRYDEIHDKLTVMGISRINMYGNQSACVNIQRLKIYCFCK